MSDSMAINRVVEFLSRLEIDPAGGVDDDRCLEALHDVLLGDAFWKEIKSQFVEFLVARQRSRPSSVLAIGDKVYYAGKTKNWKIIPDQVPALLQQINEHAAGDPEYFAQFLAANSIKPGFVADQLGEKARAAAFRESWSEDYSLKSKPRTLPKGARNAKRQ